MKKLVKGALLIPQKSTLVLDHHYVFVVGKDEIVKQERIHPGRGGRPFHRGAGAWGENDRIIFEEQS
jgi:hypothetical protein